MNVWLSPVIDLNIAAHMWCTVSVAQLSLKKKKCHKKSVDLDVCFLSVFPLANSTWWTVTFIVTFSNTF